MELVSETISAWLRLSMHESWIGSARSASRLDWDELAGIIEDAYAEVAPARLVEAARQSRG
jgi:hypothetical protein